MSTLPPHLDSHIVTAVERARELMEMLSSIRAVDIHTDNENNGGSDMWDQTSNDSLYHTWYNDLVSATTSNTYTYTLNAPYTTVATSADCSGGSLWTDRAAIEPLVFDLPEAHHIVIEQEDPENTDTDIEQNAFDDILGAEM